MITLQGGLLATLSRVFGHLNVLRISAVVFALSLFVVAGRGNSMDACDDLLCFLGIHCLSSPTEQCIRNRAADTAAE